MIRHGKDLRGALGHGLLGLYVNPSLVRSMFYSPVLMRSLIFLQLRTAVSYR